MKPKIASATRWMYPLGRSSEVATAVITTMFMGVSATNRRYQWSATANVSARMPTTTSRLISFSRNRPVAPANSRKQSRLSTAKAPIVQAAPSKTGSTMMGTMTSHERYRRRRSSFRAAQAAVSIQNEDDERSDRQGDAQHAEDQDDEWFVERMSRIRSVVPTWLVHVVLLATHVRPARAAGRP